jgi:hypothetical protein
MTYSHSITFYAYFPPKVPPDLVEVRRVPGQERHHKNILPSRVEQWPAVAVQMKDGDGAHDAKIRRDRNYGKML